MCEYYSPQFNSQGLHCTYLREHCFVCGFKFEVFCSKMYKRVNCFLSKLVISKMVCGSSKYAWIYLGCILLGLTQANGATVEITTGSSSLPLPPLPTQSTIISTIPVGSGGNGVVATGIVGGGGGTNCTNVRTLFDSRGISSVDVPSEPINGKFKKKQFLSN